MRRWTVQENASRPAVARNLVRFPRFMLSIRVYENFALVSETPVTGSSFINPNFREEHGIVSLVFAESD
ncbi:hypothetical protein [Natrinema halophilum]|uniref:hypothetical protein n=1 Tax=Natrinema halophilum TaxID=1699371 RepID=UPI001F21E694|nr:hypothetical protein [Natrinema halophilum]UHQ96079.1 hypothetical protein HYG82_22380 [Natrinema halophilum]